MSDEPARSRRRTSGPASVTLSDVARAAGVSLATASRVVNGSQDRAPGEEMRTKVLAAAERLGYFPNAHAQAMARGETAILGLIVRDISDPYFSAIAAGVSDAADEAELIVTLANTHNDPDRELQYVQTLQMQRSRAMILVGARMDDGTANLRLRRALDVFQARGGTVALVSQPILGVNTVLVENRRATADLARALYERGYRDIAVLGGPDENLTSRERALGVLETFAELGHPVPAERRVTGSFTRDGGHEAMTALLASGTSFDCVFATNDVMALGALTASREAGRRVPEDFGLAGFDDISTLQDVTPPLTTVRVPLREIGREATRLALAPAEDGPLEVRISGEVVLRDSTPPRG
ncbi:MAG: LacI family DNA-binding transcriptional regulator [Actinomycetaceae bacterium]